MTEEVKAGIGDISGLVSETGLKEKVSELTPGGGEREGQVEVGHQRKNIAGEGKRVQQC